MRVRKWLRQRDLADTLAEVLDELGKSLVGFGLLFRWL